MEKGPKLGPKAAAGLMMMLRVHPPVFRHFPGNSDFDKKN
jgi:hypothetical protein